jgi:gliding-associated putative ABC transporter substrate-binding component GldG
MKAKSFYTTAILITAILIILNLVADQFFVRLDFTEDKQYTLSKATKEILKELEEPVTIKAYFSKDLPPSIVKTQKDFLDMLVEYASISKGMLVYEFNDPGKDPETEQKVMQEGIQPVMINVREKDQMKQQKAYLGAVVSMGEKKEVLPFIQPGAAMEYDLSTAIKKLSVKDKPVVGLLQGHGEPGLRDLQQVYQGLSVLYSFEPLTLTDSTTIPDNMKTIAVIRPSDSIPAYQLKQLDDFLASGRGIFVALNRVKGDLQNAYGTTLNTGLETWLANKGIQVEPDFVIDAQCGSVTVQQQQGMFRFSSNVNFPYLPIIHSFAKHPVSEGLESVILQFASSISYIGDSSKTYTPVAFTSDKSGNLRAPQYFNIQKQWGNADFPKKRIPVAAILEGKLVGENNSKMVIVSDGDFPVGPQGQQINPDNANLMINGIDFLSDDTGLIGLRTRAVTSRPIKELEDGTKTILKYLNFLLPIFMVVLYGLFRLQRNRNKRAKRLEENYY